MSSSEWEAYQQRELEREARRIGERRVELWNAAKCPERHARQLPGGPNTYTEWWEAFHWSNNAVKSGSMFALIGDRGTGKTQIGVELIRTHTVAADKPRTCLYIRIAEMFSKIREAYGNGATVKENAVIAMFTKPWLLVLDEAHDRAHTPAESRLLNLVSDIRYAALNPTCYIANSSPDVFRTEIGESIFDRMSETGGIYPCNWKSFRVK